MGDPDQDSRPAVPGWQKSQASARSDPEPRSPDAASSLNLARRFLRDEEVQAAARERKAEFLKSKGIDEGVIARLLDEQDNESQPKAAEGSANAAEGSANAAEDGVKEAVADPPATGTATSEARDDRPPIVTYPEFLTKPARPPPLMTADRFLTTLYAFGGLSTLIYGASRYILTPMVESLTEARLSMHDTASQNLGKLVTELETTVSEIPVSKRADSAARASLDGEDTDYDDPTEMFHRDIGVQTSPPLSVTADDATPSPPSSSTENPAARQCLRLKELVASVKAVSEGLVSQSEDFADIKTVLGVFKDEIDQLRYPAPSFMGSGSAYGIGREERDDEISKAKENIRRVKGVLLSARSFPAGTR